MNSDYMYYIGCGLLGFSLVGITTSIIESFYGLLLGLLLASSISSFVCYLSSKIEEKTIEYNVTSYYDYNSKGGKDGRPNFK